MKIKPTHILYKCKASGAFLIYPIPHSYQAVMERALILLFAGSDFECELLKLILIDKENKFYED